jgi:enoyl-CoA hydratase/carnithine racemase
LHDLVGGAVAREIALTNRELTAHDALALHVVNDVVAPDELMSAVGAVVERTRQAPRDILMRTKAKALARAGIPPTTRTLDL